MRKEARYLKSFMHAILWENESKSASVRGGGSVVGNATLSLEVGTEKGLGEKSGQRKLAEEMQSKLRELCGVKQLK